MVGDRKVDVGRYPARAQMRTQRIPLRRPDDGEVRDIICSGHWRDADLRMTDGLGVRVVDLAPAGILAVQRGQFREQVRRLDLVQPAVASARHADAVLAAPAVLPQRARTLGDRPIACNDRTAIAKRAEVLRRIEAEACGLPERAGARAVTLRAMRLCAILEDCNVRPR